MADETRGDNDDDADGSSERSSWCGGCGWQPVLRAADAVKQMDEEEQIVRAVWCEARLAAQFAASPLCLHVLGEGSCIVRT